MSCGCGDKNDRKVVLDQRGVWASVQLELVLENHPQELVTDLRTGVNRRERIGDVSKGAVRRRQRFPIGWVARGQLHETNRHRPNQHRRVMVGGIPARLKALAVCGDHRLMQFRD